jgi:arylsulfatase A-like enzyme/cytochrome c-type biogenesis protein CcmH/NrfG
MKRLAPLVALGLVSCAKGPEVGDLAGWSVLLITIDTLRADRLGFAGYGPAETPNLDRLAEEGIVFEGAIAAGPVTLPSHATILTGLYPPSHGALDNGFYGLPDGVPTLATHLKGAGYATGAVIGAYVLHGQYGLDEGFDFYDDRFRQPRREDQDHRERRAERVVDSALTWLRDRSGDEPFFLWAHFYDPHAPYDPPGRYRTRFATRPYDGEIAYTDEQVGVLLDRLRETGHLDRTLVAVLADHGEAFGDGGETTHGLLLRGGTLRVPFVLWAPGALPAGRRVAGTVSNADFAPTVLELLGIVSGSSFDGRSLLAGLRRGEVTGRFAYSETRLPVDLYGWSMLAGVRTDEWAWVRAPRPELYDLASDPGESTSLHESKVAIGEGLDARVEEVLAGAREVAPRSTLPPEEVEALRALGYVFGAERPEPSNADPKDMLGIWHEVNAFRTALSAGRHDEIVVGLEEILRRDPGNVEARTLYGQALVLTDRVDDGIREFRSLFDAGMGRGSAGVLFAKTLAEAERPREAEALLRALMRADPQFAEYAFNLGVLLTEQGRPPDAVEAYEEAYRRNPDAVHVLANLSLAISEGSADEASVERAIALVDRAIELSEKDDRPRLLKIRICAEHGRVEAAREEARTLQNKPRLSGITRQELAEAMRLL